MIRILLIVIKPIYWLFWVLVPNQLGLNLPPFKEDFVLRLFSLLGYNPTKRFLNYSEQYALDYYRAHRGEMLRFPTTSGKHIPCTLLLSPAEVASPNATLRYEFRTTLFGLSPTLIDQTNEAFTALEKVLRSHRARNYNFINARLSHIRRTSDSVTLILESVPYTYYMRTNLCLDYVSKRSPQSLRSRVHPEGRLDELRESKLGNNLGINVLLITPGGQIVIQKRSMAVLVRPGELAPSFSGTVEPTDFVYGEGDWRQFHCLRESFEELAIGYDDLRTLGDGTKLKFIGITRELVRGGQAELFGVGFTNKPAEEIAQMPLAARDKYEHQKLLFFPLVDPMVSDTKERLSIFRQNVEKFVQEHSDRISLPLKANLALLDAYWDLWQEDAHSQAGETCSSATLARTGPV